MMPSSMTSARKPKSTMKKVLKLQYHLHSIITYAFRITATETFVQLSPTIFADRSTNCHPSDIRGLLASAPQSGLQYSSQPLYSQDSCLAVCATLHRNQSCRELSDISEIVECGKTSGAESMRARTARTAHSHTFT